MMSDHTETISTLFDYAIQLERAAEALYKALEKIFAHCPEVALFWKHYGDEENGHAAYLERLKSNTDAARLAEPADAKMIWAARECLKASSLERLDHVQNLEDAYQLALELENSETNTIFEFMLHNFSKDELVRSQKFIRAQLNIHIAHLENDLPILYRSSLARQNLPAVR
jgi:hypothetical protein